MTRNHRTSLRLALLPLLLLSAACEAVIDSPPVPALEDPVLPAWMNTQGTQLEGAGLAAPITANLVGVMMPDGQHYYSSVKLYHGELIGTYNGVSYTGAQLVGARFPASINGVSFTMVISAAQPHKNLIDPADPFSTKEFEYRVTVSGELNLCRGSAVSLFALAQPGIWSTSGAHSSSERQITLACQGGVLAKCSDFGYKPYLPRSGLTLAGNTSSITGENLHYVCTRMARADYCTSGSSHTVDGTRIDMYDIFKFRARSGDLPFEAAWSTSGQVVCLAKKRWETIPLGGYGCPSLPDPRQDKGARFCDPLLPVTSPMLESLGSVLYNDSSYIDAGLYLWSNGKDYYTTSRHADWGTQGQDPPDAGYASMPASQLGFQGAVYNIKSKPPAGTVLLTTYLGPTGDYYTTTVPAPAGYSYVADEGYIFPPSATPPAGARSLYTYASDTGDHATTTQPALLPASYKLVTLEGYLPR